MKNRGRDPIPLIPEKIHLLDKLESDKGKQARLITEDLTRQRLLPSTEQELQQLPEKRAQRDIRKQQVAAEAAANIQAHKHAREEQAAHEAAMAAHLGQQAMAAALAAGATPEERITADQAETVATQAGGVETMQD